jgi:hypothetical protein
MRIGPGGLAVRKWKLHAVLAVLLVFDVLWYAPWPSPITRANYDRIHIGMTEDEVTVILGPPGDYRNAENEYDGSPAHQPAHVFGRGSPHGRLDIWRSDEADVGLGFVRGEDGTLRVANGIFCYMRTKSDNPFKNMLWRARRGGSCCGVRTPRDVPLGWLDYVFGAR